ncbi:MAG: hypothetical protein RLZZ133_1673 [Pseudomonadota bacterium]|jgi:hypothetical protein
MFIYFSGLKPLDDSSQTQSVQIRLYKDAYGDFREPRCLRYQTEPLSSLPPLSLEDSFKPGSCSHIWRTRMKSLDPSKPYTERDFDAEMQAGIDRSYRQSLLYGSIIAAILSALLYAVGWVVAWVAGGFRRSK